MAFQMVQFAPHQTIVHEVALLEDTPETRKDDSKLDIIIGRDLIKSLGLTLDFAAYPPTITWEDSTVPIVPRGYCSKEETFPIIVIEAAECNYESKSPSMLAATYGKSASRSAYHRTKSST
jgi:hypothetical protein